MALWDRWRASREAVPRDVDAALRAALLAVLDRDLDRAEEMLTRALQIDSDDVEAYLALARLYRSRGEVGRAIRIHQNLLLRPNLSGEQHGTALTDLGIDFRQGGFLRRAIASFEEVLTHSPRHPVALGELVRLLAEVREHPRAVEMAKRLARVTGQRSSDLVAPLLVDMARAAHAEGRTDDARSAVKRALRRNRSCIDAWIALGDFEAERGRIKAALAAWKRVPDLDIGRGPEVYPKLEATFAALDRARDHETLLRGLIEVHPEDSGVRLALGRTLAARGDTRVAVDELQRALELEPDNLAAWSTLGRVLLSEGWDAEASKVFADLLDTLDRTGLSGQGGKPE